MPTVVRTYAAVTALGTEHLEESKNVDYYLVITCNYGSS